MEYKVIWIIGILALAGIAYWIYRIQVQSKLEAAAEAAALAVAAVAEQERVSEEATKKMAATVKTVVRSHHKARKSAKREKY